jgi:ectoine hydroxylase-related dioxygenase (phytanoyl-CoA dioxygenase family)
MFDLDEYQRDGFAVARSAVSERDATQLLEAAIALARADAAGEMQPPTFVTPEQNLTHLDALQPEDAVSKIFRVHERAPFEDIARRPALLDAIAATLDTTDVDCFLSQFIFKNAGAWGQPCHQDSFYFPFTPARPVVGMWVAATDAHLDNGCLYVIPGSHREPVHAHIRDQRENANFGYMEIVDYNLDNAVAVEMAPGDLLLFDGHLMHFSRDNTSNRRRAAMVYHYAPAGTVDHTVEQRGYTINDWMPVRRS